MKGEGKYPVWLLLSAHVSMLPVLAQIMKDCNAGMSIDFQVGGK